MMKQVVMIAVLISTLVLVAWGARWIQLTVTSLSLLRTFFPIENASLGPHVNRTIHETDEPGVRFYVFSPKDEQSKRPGVVFSMGVHPKGAEDPRLQKIFNGLVRHGFVVLAVDSPELKDSLIVPAEVDRLVAGFKFLQAYPNVQSDNVGFVSVSVGSSLAVLAAAQSDIRDAVRYVVWMGGYYDAGTLMAQVLSRKYEENGRLADWRPSERIQEVVDINLRHFAQTDPKASELVQSVLATNNYDELIKLTDAFPAEASAILEGISPATHAHNIRAPVFIIHGKDDQYMPYTHSLDLRDELPGKKELLILNQYGHAGQGVSDVFSPELWQIIFLANRWLKTIDYR